MLEKGEHIEYPNTPPLHSPPESHTFSSQTDDSYFHKPSSTGLFATLVADTNSSVPSASRSPESIASSQSNDSAAIPSYRRKRRKVRKPEIVKPTLRKRGRKPKNISTLEHDKSKPVISSLIGEDANLSQIKARKSVLESRFSRLEEAFRDFYIKNLEKTEDLIRTDSHFVLNKELLSFRNDYEHRRKHYEKYSQCLNKQLDHFFSYKVTTVHKSYQRFATLLRRHLLDKTAKRYHDLCEKRPYKYITTDLLSPSLTCFASDILQTVPEYTSSQSSPVLLPATPSIVTNKQMMDDLTLCNV
ncbi:hypothetical protein POMI540_1233 [Schizosaccharomyces pombe]